MKVVKFKNGKYAIRKWSLFYFGYVYLDTTYSSSAVWWRKRDKWFKDCYINDISIAQELLAEIKDEGVPA